MVSLVNLDYIDYFIIKIKALNISNMWCGSKKSYVLNHSCMELSHSPADDRRSSNPFCFSIPLSYFNLLENDFKGEVFCCVLHYVQMYLFPTAGFVTMFTRMRRPS